MPTVQTKREREKRMVTQMIALYCRRNHRTRGALCPDCASLADYARSRSERCPFMETKTFCANCRVHCYKARHAGENPRRHALFRPADDLPPPRGRRMARHRDKAREETTGENVMKLKQIIFLIIGCLSLALGCVGIVLPILPTVPFFLLTVFCFANSSQKLHDWFIGTQMYKKHLESFVQKKGMTVRTKATILTSVTALMAVGFVLMLRKGIIVPCVVLAVVWVCHLVYFLFGVKTIPAAETAQEN